ncbi:MAG: hypothetical protein ACRC33_15080, partial [Gemmataceae bacterium]
LVGFLAQRAEVRAVRDALRDQRLSDGSLRRFVADLQANHLPAAWSAVDLALAALAVAVAGRPTPFAAEYLAALKALSVGELPLSPRVAAEVMRRRSHIASNGRSVVAPTARPAPLGTRRLSNASPATNQRMSAVMRVGG